jgi:predicted metal-dependent hydrolase
MSTFRGAVSGRGAMIRRVLGSCLMIFSALGLVISLLGLVVVFRFSGPVASSADQALQVTVIALTTGQQNLDLAHRALGEARTALDATEAFVEGAGGGLENSSALMGSLSDMLVGDLGEVIVESQHSLAAAEEAAAVIEELLYGLNVISGLTGLTYDPDVSLTESFASMNDSLETLPQTLAELDESLIDAQANLENSQASVVELAGPLNESKVVLTEAQASLEEYGDLIGQLIQQVQDLQQNLPQWTRALVFSLYFLLIWLAITQVGLLWQGWEMVSDQPRVMDDRFDELERKVEDLARRG